jgi:hypothetical protein
MGRHNQRARVRPKRGGLGENAEPGSGCLRRRYISDPVGFRELNWEEAFLFRKLLLMITVRRKGTMSLSVAPPRNRVWLRRAGA